MPRAPQLVKKALLQGVLSPEGDGIKLDPVISGGVYLGNDTSRESFADNFARNRDEAFVQSPVEKVAMPLFRQPQGPRLCRGPLFACEKIRLMPDFFIAGGIKKAPGAAFAAPGASRYGVSGPDHSGVCSDLLCRGFRWAVMASCSRRSSVQSCWEFQLLLVGVSIAFRAILGSPVRFIVVRI